MSAKNAIKAILARHEPKLSTDLVALDVDPYWVCSCGSMMPCREGQAIRSIVEASA